MMEDLFDGAAMAAREPQLLGDGAWHLPDFASDCTHELVSTITAIASAAPFRHLVTPGGHTMSVAMTCCGSLGWHSDRQGYRYVTSDPMTGKPWPAIPGIFRTLARRAALQAGYTDFEPQACLVNRYAAGSRLSLHQDRDENALDAPIVSVSLGLPAIFLWGGVTRAARQTRHRLQNGDVVVWGGPSRLIFHGVAPLAGGVHALTGDVRLNLTFRRVRA